MMCAAHAAILVSLLVLADAAAPFLSRQRESVPAPPSFPRQLQLESDSMTVVGEVCVDYTLEGYFPSRHADFIESIPSGFVDRPATLSVCELEQLHKECVARINMYRSGELLFSNGEADPDVVGSSLAPLQENTGGNQCSSHQALGDLNIMQQQGGCGHHTSGTCPFGGARAQNSCCPRGGGESPLWTYESVRDSMFACLQGMWDEGENGGEGAATTGHHDAMKNSNFEYASCGFAWTSDGRLLMTQDFTSADQPESCSCEGKEPGSSDGCGGVCSACTEPDEPICVDQSAGPVVSSACTGAAINDEGTSFACTCDDHMRLSPGLLGGCEVPRVAAACPATCNACPEPATQCPSSDDDDDDDVQQGATTTTVAVTTTMTTTTTETTVESGCTYSVHSNTAVKYQGTGGEKLKRASFGSFTAYISACKSACDADPTCGGFVDDPTDRRGQMCKPKKASSGYSKAGKTFYNKAHCLPIER